jgi:protein-arginine kinase activator protein McsA
MTCVQCQHLATVNFAWPSAEGQQKADLCEDCARKVWDQFKHTPAFSGLIIEPVKDVA